MAGFHEPRIGLVEPGDLNRCVRVAKAQNSGPQAGWDHELYGALPGINQRGCDARACSTDRQGSGSLWESKPAPAGVLTIAVSLRPMRLVDHSTAGGCLLRGQDHARAVVVSREPSDAGHDVGNARH